MSEPVAITGPMHPASLAPWLDAGQLARQPLPFQQGGAFLSTLLRARLQRGMPTIAITTNAEITEPVHRWTGPLLRLWIVRRRTQGALRDSYRDEVRLLRDAIREAAAPLTHAHWTYEYARAALDPALPPAVVTVHDHARHLLRWVGPRWLPHFFMNRSAIRRARVLTAPSPYIADYASSIAHHEVRIVPNPLPEHLLAPPPREKKSGAPVVLILADQSAFKNVARAVAAYARWRAGGGTATLRVIGPGLDAEGPVSRQAAASGHCDGVKFEGPVPHETALAALAEASVLFHPSLEESFGSPVMEAMALGVPVIAAREAGGCAFLLDDGSCGLLPSGRSVPEMAAALATVFGHREETARRAESAARRIRELCDPDTVLRAYEDCYRLALARS